MSYAVLLAPCLVCGVPFASNPLRVPNFRGEPICERCLRRVNAERKRLGIPEFLVPEDAYEPVPEEELPS